MRAGFFGGGGRGGEAASSKPSGPSTTKPASRPKAAPEHPGAYDVFATPNVSKKKSQYDFDYGRFDRIARGVEDDPKPKGPMGLPQELIDELQEAGGDQKRVQEVAEGYLKRSMEKLEREHPLGKLKAAEKGAEEAQSGLASKLEKVKLAEEALSKVESPEDLAEFLQANGAREEEVAAALAGDHKAAAAAIERVTKGNDDEVSRAVSELDEFNSKLERTHAEVQALLKPGLPYDVEPAEGGSAVCVTFKLPSSVTKVSELELDVTPELVSVSGPGFDPTAAPMSSKVDPDTAKAKFSARTHALRVTVQLAVAGAGA